MQTLRRGVEATTKKLTARETIVNELDLKVQLLTEKPGHAVDLKERLDASVIELVWVKKVLESKEAAFKEKIRENGQMEAELRVARAAIEGGETVIHDFAERVCIG